MPVKALTQALTSLWLESPADIETEALKWYRLLLDESFLSSLVAATLKQLSILYNSEPPERLVLYIDQAEELYSRAETREAQRFSALLSEAVNNSNLTVMISLRSDYYGRLQDDVTLFKASMTVDVPPLDQVEIERVIRFPAEKLQVQFENPELISLIAEATAREPGAMPMLSDILSDAWQIMMDDANSQGLLCFPFQIVDISRPLAKKAERFFAAHNNHEEVLKRLFTLKLAHVTKEGEIVRRRTRKAECSDAEWSLIETMAERDWRLVSTGVEVGEPVAEVAHEALLRNWPRLTRWLDESREFLIWKGQLEPDRMIWEQADTVNRSRALLTGLRLDKALFWQDARNNDLTFVENQFISDSSQATTKLVRQRAWIQRALWMLLIFSSVFAVFSFWQRNQAIQAENQAIAAASLAEARRLAISAEKVFDQNIGEITLAGLLSVESLKRSPTLEGQRVLRRILELTPNEFHPVKTPWPNSKIFHSADGKMTAYYRLKYGGENWKPAAGKVAMIDASSWKVIENYPQQGRIWPVISKDGVWMAIAGYGRRLQIIDLQSHRIIIDEHQDDMIDVTFGPYGHLYVAKTDGSIEVRSKPEWQITSNLRYPLNKKRPSEVEIKVNDNGKQLLLLARGQNPYLIAVDSSNLIELKAHKKAFIGGGAFIPGGTSVATWAWGELIKWDTKNGNIQGKYKHEKKISAFTTTSDGKYLISATRAGNIFIRNSKTGHIERQLKHGAWVNGIAVSKNGLYLASVGDDRSAVLWDLKNGKKLLDLSHENEVWSVKLGLDDKTIITGGKDGKLRIFDTETGKQHQAIDFNKGILAIAHHPKSGVLVVGTRETEHEQAWADLRLVDRKTNNQIAQIEHNGGFDKMLFSPDSNLLATTTGGTGDVKIWGTQTGALKAEPKQYTDSLFFTSDSSKLISGKFLNETVIIKASDGTLLATIGEPGGIDSVSVSPNRRRITTFGQDLSFRSWDAITGKALWHRQSNRPDKYIEISADGQRYADLSASGKNIEIAEVRTGRLIASIPAGKRPLLLLSDDGDRLLTTQTNLSDSLEPEHRYSEIELWNVDEGVRLMKQRYEYSSIRSQILPGKRFAIIAGANNLKKGTLDIIDAGHGNLQWSLPIQVGFTKVRVPRNGNDFVIIDRYSNRQIREITTGNLISEIAGEGRSSSGRVVLKGKHMLFTEIQNYKRYDNAIEIRKIDDGMLVDKIPVSGYIEDISISNDRNLLFAALDNEYVKDGVRVWGTNNWSEIRFIEMDSIPKKLIPLANSDLLAVQDHSGTLRVWRISTGKEEHHFSHTLTAEGTQAASAAKRAVTWQGASLRIWDMDTGKEIAHRLSHGNISSLAFSPNGRMIAYLSGNKKTSKRGGDFQPLVIWEPDSHDEPIVLPMQFPSKVLFSPLGRRLVVLHRDHTVQIIDAATLRTVKNIRPLADSQVNNVTFSNDGDLLFIREYKNQKSSLRVFSFDPLQEITRVDDSVLPELVPESQIVMTRNAKGDWRSWKPKASNSHKLLLEIPTHSSHRLNPIKNTEYLLSYKTGGSVELLDMIQQTSKTVFPAAEGQFLRSVAINEKGKHVAVAFSSGKNTGQVVIHKLDGGKELARLSTGISISAMAFVNGGNAIVMSDTPGIANDSNKSALWLWQWHQGDLQKLSQDNPVNAIHANPTGQSFATAEGAKSIDSKETLGVPQVRIWNSQTGKEIHRISQSSPVHDVAFSRDRQFLAVKLTHKVLVYQTQDWTQIQQFDLVFDQEKRMFNLAGGKVAFGIDNRLLVRGQSNAIRIWNLDGKEQKILRHEAKYPEFKLSANGRWLVTEDKQALRIWDVLTGKEHSHVNISVNSYAFSGRDGDTLVANVKGQLMRIRWKSDDLISEACRRFRRNMTEQEWLRFFDQKPYEATCDSKAETF